jgi:phosphoglucosamine mutase
MRLFGTSGIRLVANREFTPQLALRIGLVLGSQCGSGEVLVGHDTRTSSGMISSALASGIIASGADVRFLGLVPTPVLAFLTRREGASAGVQVTASHSPPQYIGVKIFDVDGLPIDEGKQIALERGVANSDFRRADWQSLGDYSEERDPDSEYIDSVVNKTMLSKRWRVGVDSGSGATCIIVPKILRELGAEVFTVNSQPDGTFPGRAPEPTSENLADLCTLVRERKLDVGFAFDGDGDRFAVIDETGRFAHQDSSLAAYASHEVCRRGGGSVVTHVDASMCIEEAVQRSGGKLLRTKVGDVAVSRTVKSTGSIFGGEPCGSWVHPDFNPAADGILSAILFLRALETEGVTPSQFVSKIPVYPILRSKVECEPLEKESAMPLIKGRLLEAFHEMEELSELDGIRVRLSSGWILVRPSGTEPAIRITAEFRSSEETEEAMRKTLSIVKEVVGERR